MFLTFLALSEQLILAVLIFSEQWKCDDCAAATHDKTMSRLHQLEGQILIDFQFSWYWLPFSELWPSCSPSVCVWMGIILVLKASLFHEDWSIIHINPALLPWAWAMGDKWTKTFPLPCWFLTHFPLIFLYFLWSVVFVCVSFTDFNLHRGFAWEMAVHRDQSNFLSPLSATEHSAGGLHGQQE